MTIAARTPGAWTAGTTSVASIPLPTGNAAGDVNIIFVGCKPFNADIVVPAGWELIPGSDGANGSTASGIDTGSVLWKSFYRFWRSGDAAVTVTVTSGNVALGYMGGFSKAAGKEWLIAAAKGSDTTSGTGFSLTMDANPGITNGDFLVTGSVIAGDNSTFGTPTLTAASATIGAVTERPATEGTTALGNDLEASASTASCTAGTATAAPVVGWTLSVAQTGGGNIIRLREVEAVHNPVFARRAYGVRI